MVLVGSMARRGPAGMLGIATLVVALMGVSACGPRRVAVVAASPAPPPGANVQSGTVHSVVVLPAGHTWVDHGSKRYAFHDGHFYRWVPGKKHYVVVKAPHGVAVAALPRGSTVKHLRGVTYHVYRGVYYKPTRRKGKTVFVVAKL